MPLIRPRRIAAIDELSMRVDEGLVLVVQGRRLGNPEAEQIAERMLLQCAYLETLIEEAKAMTNAEWSAKHPFQGWAHRVKWHWKELKRSMGFKLRKGHSLAP